MKKITDQIASIEIEAVIGGAVQRITFAAGTNPASVPDMLRELDSAAQFRTQFFTKGGGNRDTKLARALVITAEGKNGGKFIAITAHGADGDDISIRVSKKKSDGWLQDAIALDKLSGKSADKLAAALDGGKPATVILTEHEQFGAAYFTTDDGAAYLDSMQPEAPKAASDES